jgi:hypothetical protein
MSAYGWFNVGIGVLVASNAYFNWRHSYWVRRYEKAHEAWHAEDAQRDGPVSGL